MADITMCRGTDCPNKDSCYRFTATSNKYRQSYFVEVPLKSDNTCNEYWKDERHKILKESK